MLNTKRMPAVTKWMEMSQDQVLDKFQGLKGSFSDGKGDSRFVWVEGTRDDRVILVAHADTVWTRQKVEVDYSQGIVFSKNRMQQFNHKNKWDVQSTRYGVGIGADDRAGCSIVWALRELGHSILISSGEERGCISTRWMMNNKRWREIFKHHSFAVQFDRKGMNDAVFYDVGTTPFANFVIRGTGYKPQPGSMTDIRHICKDVCGVNLSVGYYDEHTPAERLVMDQYLNTLEIARDWLSKPTPKFKTDKNDVYSPTSKFDWRKELEEDHGAYTVKLPDSTAEFILTENGLKEIPKSKKKTENTDHGTSTNDLIVCRNKSCNNRMTRTQWWQNFFRCTVCKCEL